MYAKVYFSILVGGNLDNVSIFDKELFLNESIYLTFICLVLAGFNGKKRKENTVVMLESFSVTREIFMADFSI